MHHYLSVFVIHGQNEIHKSIDGVQGCANRFTTVLLQQTEYKCPILKQNGHTFDADQVSPIQLLKI